MTSMSSVSRRLQAEQVGGEGRPVLLRLEAREFDAPALLDPRPPPNSRRPRAPPFAHHGETEPCGGLPADADDAAFRFRLAGDRIDVGGDQRVDARPAGEDVSPVDRREDAALLLAIGDAGAGDDRAASVGNARDRPGRCRAVARPRAQSRRKVLEDAATGAALCRCASSCATDRECGRC